MSENYLSIFIDESGDFGSFEAHSPFYLVSMVFHEQRIDISGDISSFENHLSNLGYPHHTIHTAPLIRRESVYHDELVEDRKRLFNSLFHFARKLDIRYTCACVDKSTCTDVIDQTGKLTKELASFFRKNDTYLNSFEKIIVYYDNGQIELTRILTSVFNTLYTHVEFRKVRPVDYRLFQVADLFCTLDLLDRKYEFTRSENEFFDNKRTFKKNYMKAIYKKQL